jgi:hypothetical protein
MSIAQIKEKSNKYLDPHQTAGSFYRRIRYFLAKDKSEKLIKELENILLSTNSVIICDEHGLRFCQADSIPDVVRQSRSGEEQKIYAERMKVEFSETGFHRLLNEGRLE